MQITRHLLPDCHASAASRLIFGCVFAGWLALAAAPSAAAEAKKKAPSTRTATPAPKITPAKPTLPAKVTKPKAEKEPERAAKSAPEPNVTIAPEELVEFQAQPAGVKKVIESSLDLTRQNLTYTAGSSDPAKGGLDCSGFIYHVLRQHGFSRVPRDASGQYAWVRQARGFRAVISRKADSFELDELLPGDLLFWTGTYTTDHDPPITHVMLYLGTEKSTGAKVMIGSSDGRTYRSQKRNGVSVFDFVMPRKQMAVDQLTTFVGYGRIPGLRD